jgi:hypothetical protein
MHMIAAGGGSVYNVTTTGAGSSLGSGFTENRWSHDNYKNQLFLVNGVDAPQDYDGTTLAATLWTGDGLTITNLRTIKAVRDRLWLTENDSSDVWYAAIGAITGPLTKFALSQIANGGKCVAIESWSKDAGDGADDLTVFVMSTGQIIIYQGDPASTFSLVGKYGGLGGAQPVDKDAVFKVGGELVVITRAGFLPVSAAAGGLAISIERIDPWGKVAPLMRQLATLHSANVGWFGIISDGFVYVTVPTLSSRFSIQVVLNLENGSWHTETGRNAASMVSFNGDLFYGAMTGGTVHKVGGGADGTVSITASARTAFTIPDDDFSKTNLYTAARLKMQAQGSVSGTLGVDTDFFDTTLVGIPTTLAEDVDTTPWSSDWGSPWGSKPKPNTEWISVSGEGRSVAPKLVATSDALSVTWYATDILWKQGGIKSGQDDGTLRLTSR